MGYKIIAIMGKAGSGKDTILQQVLTKNYNLNEIISCTTRPKREGEKEGVNYYYLTPEQFGDKVLHNEMLEATCFNDWFYGTSYEALRTDTINIGVFNPAGIEALMSHPDVEVTVFYIYASDKIRLLRQLNRENDPNVNEIIRRFKADEKDFSDLNFEYQIIENNYHNNLTFAVNTILSTIKSLQDKND